MTELITDYFIRFNKVVNANDLPKQFTYPFYYTPHPLCIAAAEQLQREVIANASWLHNFGIDPKDSTNAIGKMFGVLVVQNNEQELGFIAAFSGKIADENHHPPFVPPVYDLLSIQGFYRSEEAEITLLNKEIERLTMAMQSDKKLSELETTYNSLITQLELEKIKAKEAKIVRDEKRKEIQENEDNEYKIDQEARLIEESKRDHFMLKDTKKMVLNSKAILETKRNEYQEKIDQLKELRKQKSAVLQKKIFGHYVFYNASGETKNIAQIFMESLGVAPPAGAGECAAPKLLNFAFLHQLKPIAMAEFWWGLSPIGEVRIHQQYYPACKSKCEPLLGFMLQGLSIEENRLHNKNDVRDHIETLYEDDDLLVINKPAEILSVPGKGNAESIYSIMLERYTDTHRIFIVHRLDMATSGVMLIAKNELTYKALQNQFIERQVKKSYIALLEGELKPNTIGKINLPLRVDLDDRPRQVVCYEYGKEAHTDYEVLKTEIGRTRIQFYPRTGRTHQLRVHAAHSMGLNRPIIGDDLYGHKADRLYLHAYTLEFVHPRTGETMRIKSEPDF